MKSRSTSVIVAALAAMISASPAPAGGLKQVAEISIPGEPITDIGIMAIDQTTGLGYLADKTNKSVVVFDTKTDKFVARIPGFVGRLKDGNASGPNGVVVVKGEVWVSDGDSTIKVIDAKTGQVTGTVATGERARQRMAVGEQRRRHRRHPNDAPPLASSDAPDHKTLAKILIPNPANLERSRTRPSGMFYSHPGIRADTTKGYDRSQKRQAREVARTRVSSDVSPSSRTQPFSRCSTPRPSPKPGGDMAIFDIAAGKVETVLAGYGGNGGSTVNRKLGQYYHSTSGGTLMVVDTKTKKGLQQIPTSNGARSLGVSLANNRVYVATTAKELACRGCIVVYAPE
jgi:DNA-binding beta-propeller fold protein YncE